MEVMKESTEQNFYEYEEEFRNSMATVDEKGKRIWIYPKKPSGHYHRLRILVTTFLLSIFFAGPFITLNGRPFMLFNIFERKFIFFGQVFWPQDFFLLALTLITLFVFVILFTVAFGRLWCGWACPQTLFMEMVFRKIEYWIEGDANAQRRLNKGPWNGERILKKGAKQLIFVLISILISHTTMAYLIGIDQVKEIVSQPPTENMAGFIGLIAFTGVFYGVFAYFREQACIAVCPYGRLQGVLLVKDSIVVAYDWLRGEPRGKLKKNQSTITEKQGDCIDCKLCIHVCPTGIDIRNGTQLECVNCTACMDACDDVMIKINKPKGLIRLSSYTAIKEGAQKLFTPRIAGYLIVLTALITLLSYLIFTRADIETTILKVPGTLYTKTDDGQITNLYTIEFLNKTYDDIPLEVKIESPAEATYMKIGDPAIVVPKEGILKGMIMVKLPESAISSMKTVIELGIYQNGEKVETAKAKFIGPIVKMKTQ
ncbi:MAG: cytochrome c oxidase accessory protein CcoG [Flammeovirgaceae bacterium]|nr:cytochrome c oxidase accessory protein CcoG [Flammeovirgaceae bacterium]